MPYSPSPYYNVIPPAPKPVVTQPVATQPAATSPTSTMTYDEIMRQIAAGSHAGANASSAAAGTAGAAATTAQQSTQAGAMAGASGAAAAPASSMSYNDIMRQIAAGSHAGANASSAAAGVAGNTAAATAAGSTAAAANTASMPYGIPPPPPDFPQYQPPAYNPSYDPSQVNIPYATWDNIQPYFNPMYQFMLDSGTNAIQNSAAAHNMLHSSGTIQDIGDWATKSAGTAYDSAVQKFMDDRAGVYNIGSDLRNFDWTNYTYQNAQGLDAYNSNKTDYQNQLADYYKQMLGLSGVGQTAAGKAGDLTTSSATAMANLFMAMAQMQSMGGQAQANNQSGFMGSLISMIPLIAPLLAAA